MEPGTYGSLINICWMLESFVRGLSSEMTCSLLDAMEVVKVGGERLASFLDSSLATTRARHAP